MKASLVHKLHESPIIPAVANKYMSTRAYMCKESGVMASVIFHHSRLRKSKYDCNYENGQVLVYRYVPKEKSACVSRHSRVFPGLQMVQISVSQLTTSSVNIVASVPSARAVA